MEPNKKKRKIDDFSEEALQKPILKKSRTKKIDAKELAAITAKNIDAVLDEEVSLDEQIVELDRRITVVGEAYSEIDKNSSNYRAGVFNPDSYRVVLSRLAKAHNKLIAQKKEKTELQRRRNELAGRMIAVPDNDNTAYSGDGNCHIRFVNVGMGDCTLISTPEGKKIMIDLGSDSLRDAILNTVLDSDLNQDSTNSTELDKYSSALTFISDRIKSNVFLYGEDSIDILLLTHPDEDHHKYIKPILKGKLNIQTIGITYYSGAEDITRFASGTSEFLKGITTTKKITLREEDIKDDDDTIRLTKTINDKFISTTKRTAAVVGEEFIDATTGAIVLYYEESSKSNFKLSILSGNVKGVWTAAGFKQAESDIKGGGEMVQNSTPQNRGSLVILVECFGKGVLICGDATAVTEKFITKYFSTSLGTNNLLQKVNYLRVAHHGSPTSSARFFLSGQTALKRAVVSTGGQKTVKHKLPKKRIIEEYVNNPLLSANNLTELPPTHTIYCFDNDTSSIASDFYKDINDEVMATGSSGTVALTLKR